MNVVPRALIPVLLVTLSLLAPFGATAQDPKPVKSVTGIILKAVPKAIAGDEKAAEKLAALGPVTRRAAADTEKRLLRKWRFKKLKAGRHTIELDVDGQAREYALEVPAGAGAHAEVKAEVKTGANNCNVIEVTGAKKIVLWLADGLIDLDQELVVNLEGKEVFRGKTERRFTTLVADLKDRFDRLAPAWARLEVGE